MSKNTNDTVEVEGTVIDLLPNALFKLKLDYGEEILAHLSGKMRIKYIKLAKGDRVRVEISKYDRQKGRITYRLSKRTIFSSYHKKK